MPKAYPVELRTRVVEAYQNGEGTYIELAARFKVGEATVDRWVALARCGLSLERRKAPGRTGMDIIGQPGLDFIRA